ncbi:MAG: type II secretion system major pseudopilin GspG [Pirellulales bacterium]|nr:type II secretion system major pseudopilin GspG [Pirellulales bacterium]
MKAAFWSWVLWCAVAPQVQTSQTPETLLYIRTTPSGAEISLDGKPLGTSDGLFPVKPGTYKIVVDLQDHQPKQQSITLRDGQITRIELELQATAGRRRATARPLIPRPAFGRFDVRLELRVAPAAPGCEFATLAKEHVARYRKDLQTKGPLAGRVPEALYAWFELRVEPSPELITAEYQGATYVLLSNRPDEVMLASRDGADAWGLTSVDVTADGRGAPAIGAEMDEAGARLLAALSGSHLGQRVAILLCDQVLAAPVVRGKISERIAITGQFERREVEELVAALRASLARPGAGAPTATVESRVLADACAQMLGDFVAARKQAGGKIPDDWDSPQFVPRTIEQCKRQYPGPFAVTPEEERRFTAGEFDDAAASRRAGEAIQSLTKDKVELPAGAQYLIDEFQTGRLQGARLELAARLLAAQLQDTAQMQHRSVQTALKLLETSLACYQLDLGVYPTTDEGLAALTSKPATAGTQEKWQGPYASELPRDPWGHDYRYRRPGKHQPDSFDLWSVGPDGLDGTADDVGNWPEHDDAADDNRPADPNRRPRYFVRLVLGDDTMTLEGATTTWEELPELLERVPNRGQTVLEIAVAAEKPSDKQRADAMRRASGLARRFGFEYPSIVGVHPLGSRGAPPQTDSPKAAPAPETSDGAAKEVLRRYSQAVWAEALPRLESASGPEATEMIQQVAMEAAQRHILPQKDLVARYALSRMPDAEPVDASQWTEKVVFRPEDDAADSPRQPTAFWHPIVVAAGLQQQVMVKDMSAKRFGTFAMSRFYAPAPTTVLDRNLDHPVIATAFGDQLLVAHLRRADDGLYHGEQVRWLTKRPAATQDYFLLPVGATPAQRLVHTFSKIVWNDLLPRLAGQEPEVLAKELGRFSRRFFVKHHELLKAEGERLLAELPKSEPIDFSQWTSRFPETTDEMSEAMRHAMASERADIGIGDVHLCFNPVQMAAMMQQTTLARLAGPGMLGLRSMVRAAAVYPLDAILDGDPQRPAIATRMGDELSIVRLRRQPNGAYEFDRIEWLVRAKADSKATKAAPRRK